MDVNQITSSLRMMGDQQLQQYAAMHKADPYILSLAVSESNQRKQMRAEQMAKMSGQKPPTVVEQDIQGMAPPPQISHDLPEHQGIGALPAQNMQRMADGGIARHQPVAVADACLGAEVTARREHTRLPARPVRT